MIKQLNVIRILSSLAFTVVLLILIIGITIFRNNFQMEEILGEAQEIIPAKLIERGEKHPSYTSIPPSSGWYVESNIRTGIFNDFISDEQIVEFLKKGLVVINYNCNYKTVTSLNSKKIESTPSSKINLMGENNQTTEEAQMVYQQVQEQNARCGKLIGGLRKIVESVDQDKLVLAPNPKLDSRIALVSWGRVDKMMWVDEERINKFIRTFSGKAIND